MNETEYRCGDCGIGHWYSGEYEYVSVVTPGGGTEKRPCKPHTHYCCDFAEGRRKIAGDEDFDPEDTPVWCPRRERANWEESARKPLVSLKEQPAMPPPPERDIRTVTLEIKTLHSQFQQIVLGYAIEIGRRLVEAKSLLKHGEWGDWLRDEVNFSQSTANNLMRIFEEYGSAQMGLFGPEANSQTLGNLPYSKALKLLALPSEEREEFAKANNVEELSTRELDKIIRERDEAKKEAAENHAQYTAEWEKNEELGNKLESAEEQLIKAREEAEETAGRLKRELEELRARPVDVAVQAADPKELEKARKEARAAAEKELKAKLDAAEKKLKDAREEAEKAKKAAAEHAKALEEQSAKARSALDEELRREKESAQAKLEALEKQLKVAGSPAVAEFKVHFDGAQREIGAMLDCLGRIKDAGDLEHHGKLRKALSALAGYISSSTPAEEGGGTDGEENERAG